MQSRFAVATLSGATLSLFAATAIAAPAPDIYTDAAFDIAEGLTNGEGTLDLLSMEVSNTATDIQFALTVRGNISSTDWGKFMIGIAAGGASASNGNGWGRPINMDSASGGMTTWLGSWVDGGGGAENRTYSSGSWGLTGATYNGNFGTISLASGTQSTLTLTVSLASLGLGVGDTFYFDAYSSGGGGSDGAIDALANPNVSVSNWGDSYTSGGSNPIFSYTVVPAPGAIALISLVGLTAGRRRSRKA